VRRFLGGLAASAALGTIVADASSSPAVFASKPLAMLALMAWTLRAAPVPSARYRGLIAAGLLCSLVGDVLLLWPESLFVAGLLAFLVAHVCYLTAFRTDGGERPSPLLLFPLGAVAVAVLAVTWKALGPLRLPVVVYMAVIVAMWWAALGRHHALRNRSAILAAAGATAFVASDGLLALNRFWKPLPAAALLVLIPYYAAQLLLAASVGKGADTT
jgi:uncharacterized membrane protein YhhN